MPVILVVTAPDLQRSLPFCSATTSQSEVCGHIQRFLCRSFDKMEVALLIVRDRFKLTTDRTRCCLDTHDEDDDDDDELSFVPDDVCFPRNFISSFFFLLHKQSYNSLDYY